MTNFEQLEMQFGAAKDEGEIVSLIIKNGNNPIAELILVHPEMMDKKLAYIKEAYSADLRLRNNWDIFIDGFYRMNDPQLKALMEGIILQ